MIRRVLVGLGGTPFTDAAIQQAISMAQRHGAELTGITVVDVERLLDVGPVPVGASTHARRLREHRYSEAMEQVEQAVSRFEAACQQADIAHRVAREHGDPFDLLIDYSRYHDLVVFALRSLFGYGIAPAPRDIIMRLISQFVHPLLAVSSHFREVRKVLVAYGGSIGAANAMKSFIKTMPFGRVDLRIACFGKEEGEAEHLLENAALYCRVHGIEPELEYVPGEAPKQLLSYADKCGADLIVLGYNTRNILLRNLLGSTMVHAIQHADRPLYLSR